MKTSTFWKLNSKTELMNINGRSNILGKISEHRVGKQTSTEIFPIQILF